MNQSRPPSVEELRAERERFDSLSQLEKAIQHITQIIESYRNTCDGTIYVEADLMYGTGTQMKNETDRRAFLIHFAQQDGYCVKMRNVNVPCEVLKADWPDITRLFDGFRYATIVVKIFDKKK